MKMLLVTFELCWMRILTATHVRFALGLTAIAVAAMTVVLPAETRAQTPAEMSLPSPASIVAALQKGGYIVYFRHTATDFSKNDHAMKDFDDCANQRNLSDEGRAQARKVGDAWKRLKIPVGRVLASPFCRTREVAQLMFGRYERALDVRGGPSSAGDSVRYQPLASLLETPPARGTNDVISSHGNPFRALHPELSYLGEGEAAIIEPGKTGASRSDGAASTSVGHRVVGRITWDQWQTVAR